MPAVFGGGLGGIGRFARATAANPLWLTALLADLGGVGLQWRLATRSAEQDRANGTAAVAADTRDRDTNPVAAHAWDEALRCWSCPLPSAAPTSPAPRPVAHFESRRAPRGRARCGGALRRQPEGPVAVRPNPASTKSVGRHPGGASSRGCRIPVVPGGVARSSPDLRHLWP